MGGTKCQILMVPHFEALLAGEEGVKEVIHSAAELAMEVALAEAPVGDSGDYRDGIGVEDNELVATDWKSHWIEWGSVNNRAYAVLRNAAREVAAKVVELPKP